MSSLELSADIAFGDAARLQLPAYTNTCVAMLPGTLKGNVEALHDLRVASRRLRAALGIYSTAFAPKAARSLLRSAKALTSALGPVRDLDVQLGALEKASEGLVKTEREGLRRVIRRLKRLRLRERRIMRRQLRRWSGKRFNAELEKTLLEPLPDAPLSTFAGVITTAWERVAIFWPVVQDPGKVAELHEMRIVTKRLRYTLELFAPTLPEAKAALVKPLTQIQEHLGQIHDLDVLLPLLEQGLRREKRRKRAGKKAAAGLSHVIAQTVAERVRLYEEFIALWSAHGEPFSALA